MRFSIIKTVFWKELTELLRNRRSLIVMFGVPLLLYPLLTIAVASLAQSKQDELTRRSALVLVVRPDDAPKLWELLRAPDSGIDAESADLADAQARLKEGGADAVIDVPPNYETNVVNGKDAELKLNIMLDRTRTATPFAERKLDKVLSAYQQWVVEQRLKSRYLEPSLARPPSHVKTDIATSGQTLGILLSRMLPLLLLLTGMLGALYPALNATTTERELGTLETLLVTPATRGELLTAKAAMVLLSSLLTALLNMLSMSLVLWRMQSQLSNGAVSSAIDPGALALSFLAAVPTLIFFAALVLMVGLLARNLREANAYATPVMLLPIASMLVGIAEPSTSPGLLVTPVANTTVIIRDVLTGHYSVAAFALAFVSSCVYAMLVLSLAARVFTNEQLVNPAWEPLSLRGFGRRAKNTCRRFPAMDEAFALASLSLLLNFYISPSWLKHGVIALLVVVEIGLNAGPALLFGWIGRYRWREVFSLSPPKFTALLGAAFIGLGLIPVVQAIGWFQEHFQLLPQSRDNGLEQMLDPVLQLHPIILPLLVGLLAGTCEELLFRGPLQNAFVRRLPIGLALCLGGFIFAAAHVDLSGFPVRFGLGVMLGWVVWHTGSIFPAMLLHACYDAGALALSAFHNLHPDSKSPLLIDLDKQPQHQLLTIGAGIFVAVIGWWLVQESPGDRPA